MWSFRQFYPHSITLVNTPGSRLAEERVQSYPRKLWIAPRSGGELAGVKKAAYPSV